MIYLSFCFSLRMFCDWMETIHFEKLAIVKFIILPVVLNITKGSEYCYDVTSGDCNRGPFVKDLRMRVYGYNLQGRKHPTKSF